MTTKHPRILHLALDCVAKKRQKPRTNPSGKGRKLWQNATAIASPSPHPLSSSAFSLIGWSGGKDCLPRPSESEGHTSSDTPVRVPNCNSSILQRPLATTIITSYHSLEVAAGRLAAVKRRKVNLSCVDSPASIRATPFSKFCIFRWRPCANNIVESH